MNKPIHFLKRSAESGTELTADVIERYVGDLAHDLRTPLAIIKTSTEVALMDPSISAQQVQLHRDILTELSRVTKILNDFLSSDTIDE